MIPKTRIMRTKIPIPPKEPEELKVFSPEAPESEFSEKSNEI